MERRTIKLALIFLAIGVFVFVKFNEKGKMMTQTVTQLDPSDSLVIVWTSGDREVALKMVFMYAFNAKKYEWWKDITLPVWGPSSKLLKTRRALCLRNAGRRVLGA